MMGRRAAVRRDDLVSQTSSHQGLRVRRSREAQPPPGIYTTAQQKYALLAEHIPEPPRRAQTQRPAVKIERDRAFHLDVDLVAELHEILDGAEMDVRRVVPGGREVFRARHVTANEELQSHPPEAEIRKRDDGAAADP